MNKDKTIGDRDREIARLKAEIDSLNKDGGNKDDRFKAMEERYKAIIAEKDTIIARFESKLRDMGNQLQQVQIELEAVKDANSNIIKDRDREIFNLKPCRLSMTKLID